MNKKVTRNLAYGVYLLTAREGDKDNACIINTAVQVANDPVCISLAVIKNNLTCDMIAHTGICNLSPLTEDAEFSLFQRFGMQSGRTVDKFNGFSSVARSENGLLYLTDQSNAYLSLKIVSSLDMGSHMLFIGQLTDGEVLSPAPTASYAYYQSVIKNRSQPAAVHTEPAAAPGGKSKKWVCTVCGYVYEGESLPEDYVCPLCQHGAEVFELMEEEPVPQTSGKTKKWVCTVCGYVYEGESLPEDYVCPLCQHGAEVFELMEEEAPAAEETSQNTKWVCAYCGYEYEGPEPPETCPLCQAPASAFEKA